MTLIERLEAAETGSRELDAAIAVAAKHDLPSPMGECPATLRVYKCDGEAPGSYWLIQRSGKSLRTAPHFSTSIDAALTLVPEGWWISRIYQDEDGFEVMLIDPSSDEGMGTPNYVEAVLMADGNGIPTIALALCIAALKAREQTND